MNGIMLAKLLFPLFFIPLASTTASGSVDHVQIPSESAAGHTSITIQSGSFSTSTALTISHGSATEVVHTSVNGVAHTYATTTALTAADVAKLRENQTFFERALHDFITAERKRFESLFDPML